MRILLVNPPCDPRTIGLRHMAKIEPLGLETVGAAVSQEHDVRLVDMEVAPEDLQRTLDAFTPDVVGVTSEIVHVSTALQVLRQVRDRYPACLTVMGGHHATMRPEDFADPAVDLIVLGEGTTSFREICAIHAARGHDFTGIAGLAIPSGPGAVERTSPRPLPTDLDTLPLPDRSLTAPYRDRYYYLHEPSVAAVRTSFGCTHFCIFCSVRVYSEGRFFARSAEHVFEEIRSLDEDFVMFCDDHSFLDPERMRRLGHLLLDAGIDKRYFAYARADSIVAHRDVFALWAEVGLSLVMTGLEAMDGAALKRSGKQTSEDTNEQAVRIAEDLGFGISAGFLVEPEFDRADFERIDRYARERPSIAIVEYTALTPFPGTPLYRKEADRLLTHDPAFYDLQHFVLPTRLPTRELYDLMLEYHTRSSWRLIRRLLRRRPGVFLSPHLTRLVPGLLANARAYREAHLHAPDRRPDEPSRDASTPPDTVHLAYEGWSGWRVSGAETPLPPVRFDPAPGTRWPDERCLVCLTHGHPEHVRATIEHLDRHDRAPVTVIASQALCQYLEGHTTPGRHDRFRAIAPGTSTALDGWSLEAFTWDHMPLIPPEPRLAARHLRRLAAHPRKLLGVVRDGLVGPPHGPMLGYVLTCSGSEHRVVYYGEGLHRRTSRRALRAILPEGVPSTVIAGLEPEDVERLPALLQSLHIEQLLLFEPHGPWRDSFDLPRVDADAARDAFTGRGVDTRLLHPGDAITLDPGQASLRQPAQATSRAETPL